jgi:hypothetical protein
MILSVTPVGKEGRMKFWHLILAFFVIWLVFGGDEKSSHREGFSTEQADYLPPTYNSGLRPPRYPRRDNSEKPDGDYDCTVMNISSGLGPYTLQCEKNGDDITINFPNGGYIVVDSDGYHAVRGEQWEVELD